MKLRNLLIAKMLIKLVIILVISSGLQSCLNNVEHSGYALNEEQLEFVYINFSSKDDVQRILGSPSSKSHYVNDVWYYLTTMTTNNAFSKPKIVNQTVVAIEFDENNKVVAIKRHDFDKHNKIAFSKEATSANGDNLGIIGQFIGNLGKFKSNSRNNSGGGE